MMTVSELEKLKEVKIENIDKSVLINVDDVEINDALPKAARMLDYLEKVKNPYCFLCGGVPVKIVFIEKETELEIKLKEYFFSLKR